MYVPGGRATRITALLNIEALEQDVVQAVVGQCNVRVNAILYQLYLDARGDAGTVMRDDAQGETHIASGR